MRSTALFHTVVGPKTHETKALYYAKKETRELGVETNLDGSYRIRTIDDN